MLDFGTEKKQCFDDYENGSLIISDDKCADLEVYSIDAETIGGSEYKTWCARCIHEDACHRIKDVTIENMRNE